MHAKETHIDTVDLLEGKKCFGSVREALRHLVVVYKPVRDRKPLISESSCHDLKQCFIHVCTHLAFMPGLTSTVLSELATTRTNTSPASGWFCLFKYLFTRSSIYVPNRVTCNPDTHTERDTAH